MIVHDPIHKEDGFWWFWEETWAHKSGPFNTRGEAIEMLDLYCTHILGGGTKCINLETPQPLNSMPSPLEPLATPPSKIA